MYKKIIFALVLLLISAGSALAQWQPPTAAPPLNNAPSPLNVSSVTQTKAADLILDNLELTAGGKVRFGPTGLQYILGASNSYLEYFSNHPEVADIRFYNNTGPAGHLGRVYGRKAGTTVQFGLLDDLGRFIIEHITDNFTFLRIAGNAIMTLESSGDVGIGTIDPENKLHLFNNTVVNDTLTIPLKLEARFQTGPSVPLTIADRIGIAFKFRNQNNSVVQEFTPIRYNIAPQTLSLVADGGNVGIGTPAPTEKLDVTGNIKASGTICNSAGCLGAAAPTPTLQQVTDQGFSTTDGIILGSMGGTWAGWSETIRINPTQLQGAITLPSTGDATFPGGLLFGLHGDQNFYWANTLSGSYIMTLGPAGLWIPNGFSANTVSATGVINAPLIKASTFTDVDDPAYLVNPNSISYLNDIRPSIIYDRDNTDFQVDPNGWNYMGYLFPGYPGPIAPTRNISYYLYGRSGSGLGTNGGLYAAGTVYSNGFPVCQSNGVNCPMKVVSGNGVLTSQCNSPTPNGTCNSHWYVDISYGVTFNTAPKVIISPQNMSAGPPCTGGSTDFIYVEATLITTTGFRAIGSGSPTVQNPCGNESAYSQARIGWLAVGI